MKIGRFVIFREKAGVISKDAIWICFHSCYMYEHNWFIGLIIKMIREWKKERNLIG